MRENGMQDLLRPIFSRRKRPPQRDVPRMRDAAHSPNHAATQQYGTAQSGTPPRLHAHPAALPRELQLSVHAATASPCFTNDALAVHSRRYCSATAAPCSLLHICLPALVILLVPLLPYPSFIRKRHTFAIDSLCNRCHCRHITVVPERRAAVPCSGSRPQHTTWNL